MSKYDNGITRCQCGRPTHYSASSCEACYARAAPYDERNPNWQVDEKPCPGCYNAMPKGAGICMSCHQKLNKR